MYEDRTAETIRAEMASDMQKLTGMSPVSGGFVDMLIGRTAVEHAKVYQALNAVFSLLFVDEDSGGFLDLHGDAYHNLHRREGTKARASMSFRGTPGTQIQQGTAFFADGGLEFDLSAPVTIGTNGVGRGWAQAAKVGGQYNVAADALSQMHINLVGLEEWHNTAAEGGSDEETDAALYARIDEKRKHPPTSGNIHDYRQWALEVSGVGAVKVIPLQDGPGTVNALIVGNDMEPATDDLVDSVAANIERQRPIGPKVTVQAPGRTPIAIVATVELVEGATAAAVRDGFTSSVRGYLDDLVRRKYTAIYANSEEDKPYTIVYNRISALLMDVAGVSDYTTLLVNGTPGDVVVPSDHVPVLSEVTVDGSQ